jgi:hypothetical protein
LKVAELLSAAPVFDGNFGAAMQLDLKVVDG